MSETVTYVGEYDGDVDMAPSPHASEPDRAPTDTGFDLKPESQQEALEHAKGVRAYELRAGRLVKPAYSIWTGHEVDQAAHARTGRQVSRVAINYMRGLSPVVQSQWAGY
jgi:hypothetical protein